MSQIIYEGGKGKCIFSQPHTISHIANTIELELQSGITLARLILQSLIFYQTCIVLWLRYGANLNKIGRDLIQVNKILNGHYDINWEDFFTLDTNRTHNTRGHSQKLVKHRTLTSLRQKSFC